ncbi:LacI family DNA-binding transcriptional regulator [Clostridium oryzae]|uniref:Catabolite control protein A n=1 Tax=Clostridium oryzae TaxID=1450648 RepID=A0A1V4I6R3_9CLOT|nr:LacI family DNA-binding transcriptional regulator [Clostridium oryzae]OPJ55227.1 catabolite control protein A [Clostridium oryzae]
MPVTINDVAREAGVSITTVSRVVNNNYPVKKETREKIERAIKKLGYTPNIMARGLITKKTSMIGVIVPGITNLFFPTIVEAIEEKIKSKGYNISLSNTGGDAELEKEVVNSIISRQVDGIIIIDPRVENIKNDFYEELSSRLPIMIINGLTYGDKCNFVSYNEKVGTKEAMDYLVSLGHKRIAFVRGHKSYSYDIKEEIYNETLRENGFTYNEVINVGKGNSIEVVNNTEMMIEKLFNSEVQPTAVFACNDLMAVGVLNTCSRLNIRVPEDVSVIGCDNTIIASISSPKLTSVDLDMKGIGNKAAEQLILIIEELKKERCSVVSDTKLVIRDSCGKVREEKKELREKS